MNQKLLGREVEVTESVSSFGYPNLILKMPLTVGEESIIRKIMEKVSPSYNFSKGYNAWMLDEFNEWMKEYDSHLKEEWKYVVNKFRIDPSGVNKKPYILMESKVTKPELDRKAILVCFQDNLETFFTMVGLDPTRVVEAEVKREKISTEEIQRLKKELLG